MVIILGYTDGIVIGPDEGRILVYNNGLVIGIKIVSTEENNIWY